MQLIWVSWGKSACFWEVCYSTVQKMHGETSGQVFAFVSNVLPLSQSGHIIYVSLFFSKDAVTINQEPEIISLTYTFIHCGLPSLLTNFFLPSTSSLYQHEHSKCLKVVSTLPDFFFILFLNSFSFKKYPFLWQSNLI